MYKVLHVLASNKFSGAENVVCTLINNMREDYNMAYCSPKGNIAKKLEELSIPFYGLEKLNIKNLKKIIAEFKPDIIHAHDYTASVISASTGFKGKIISHLHNNCPFAKKWNLKTIIYSLNIKKITNVIGVSNQVYSEAVFKNKIKNKYKTIYNCVDKTLVLNKSLEYDFDKEYDLLFFGRITEQKNPLLFLNIVKKISETNKNISAVMIGDGDLFDKCKDYIVDNNLEKNVDMIGFISNPFPIVKKCKIGVMPSKWEGFGLTVVEMLCLDVPVLNSGVGGLFEIFNNYKEFICENDNEYIQKISLLLNNDMKYNLSDITDRFINLENWKNEIEKIYID